MPKHLVSTARAAALVGFVAFALAACSGDAFAREYAALRAEALARAAYRFGPGRPAGVPWSPPRLLAAGAPATVREAAPRESATPTNEVTRGSRPLVGLPIEHADLGLTQLVDRGLGATVDQVVEDFELAFPEGQGDPTFLNDFATALLERARPRDLILGGEYAARARNAAEEDDPDGDLARAARFNWALAMERLALHGQATAAWQAVLARESDASWRAEAETHAADLTEWPVARWPKERERLRQAAARGDQATVAEILPDFRTAARLLAEDEELATWAENIERDPPKAREALAVARTIGQVLEPTDAFLADVVAVIDAAAGDVKKTAELATAMRGFFGGLEAYKEFAYESSQKSLDKSSEELAALASPLAHRAAFFSLASSNGLGLTSLAGKLNWTDRFLARLPEEYAVLRAQAHYSRGAVQVWAGFSESSIPDLETSVAALETLGERDLEPAYRSMLGDALSRAHRTEDAAREDARWLVDARRIVQPYYRTFVAAAAILRARDAVCLETRLAAVRESVIEATRNSRISVVASCLTYLFESLCLLGRLEEAEQVRLEVEAANRQIFDPLDLARNQADLLRAESKFSRNRLKLLKDAAELYSSNSQLALQQIEVLQEITKGEFDSGRFDAARAASERAFALLERRARLPGGDRLAIAAEVRPTVDLWLRATLEDPEASATDEELLLWAERRHHLSAPGPWAELVSADVIRREVPEETALVELVPLAERVLVLVATKKSISRWWLEVPQLGEVVDCLDPRKPGHCDESWDEAAASFARAAVEPWLCALPAGKRLVLVPGSLARVPFAALPLQCPGEAQARLVERHVSSLAPSATFWLSARNRATDLAATGPARRVLAVGLKQAIGFAAELQRAEDEAQQIAAAYPEGRTLLGRRATQAAIQAEAENAEILHFATHGAIDKNDPNGSYLALAESRLAVGELAGPSGRLPKTRLAVLSACETGGEIEGIEGLVGVSRAFLEIGIPTVVATLSEVDDEFSISLMLRFYRLYRNTGDAALALAEAQRVAQTHPSSGKDRELTESENERDGPPEWAKWVVVGVSPVLDKRSETRTAGGVK